MDNPRYHRAVPERCMILVVYDRSRRLIQYGSRGSAHICRGYSIHYCGSRLAYITHLRGISVPAASIIVTR